MPVIRAKRTYNLSEQVIEMVRSLAAQGVARSQDAVVEMAVTELARQQAEAASAERWARAATDPVFQREVRRIEREFATADAEIWPE